MHHKEAQNHPKVDGKFFCIADIVKQIKNTIRDIFANMLIVFMVCSLVSFFAFAPHIDPLNN